MYECQCQSKDNTFGYFHVFSPLIELYFILLSKENATNFVGYEFYKRSIDVC